MGRFEAQISASVGAFSVDFGGQCRLKHATSFGTITLIGRKAPLERFGSIASFRETVRHNIQSENIHAY
jgi:hypothetical protein